MNSQVIWVREREGDFAEMCQVATISFPVLSLQIKGLFEATTILQDEVSRKDENILALFQK